MHLRQRIISPGQRSGHKKTFFSVFSVLISVRNQLCNMERWYVTRHRGVREQERRRGWREPTHQSDWNVSSTEAFIFYIKKCFFSIGNPYLCSLAKAEQKLGCKTVHESPPELSSVAMQPARLCFLAADSEQRLQPLNPAALWGVRWCFFKRPWIHIYPFGFFPWVMGPHMNTAFLIVSLGRTYQSEVGGAQRESEVNESPGFVCLCWSDQVKSQLWCTNGADELSFWFKPTLIRDRFLSTIRNCG